MTSTTSFYCFLSNFTRREVMFWTPLIPRFARFPRCHSRCNSLFFYDSIIDYQTNSSHSCSNAASGLFDQVYSSSQDSRNLKFSSRQSTGQLFPCGVTNWLVTITWQLPIFPSVPEYCRATPTDPLPFFGMPVSSKMRYPGSRPYCCKNTPAACH